MIEWNAGGDLSPTRSTHKELPSLGDDSKLDEREKRRLRRDQKRVEKEKAEKAELPIGNAHDADSSAEVIYVA